MTERRTVVGLGELLWDLLPGGKQLGGAPANFAYHAALLGDDGIMASRVGEDELGREIYAYVDSLNLGTSWIQIDATHPTGTVQVDIDDAGQPSYTIVDEVAWDFLEWTDGLAALAGRADAVCFGSLSQRSRTSRDTIRRFLRATRKDCARVLDINLRQTFYSVEVLEESLKLATILKLNHEELPEVLKILGRPAAGHDGGAGQLRQDYGLDLVCVTRGAAGSLLIADGERADHPGVNVTVADAVGAGDAFTAALTHHWLRGAPLTVISEAANCMGAWVASQSGATPKPDPTVIKKVTGST